MTRIPDRVDTFLIAEVVALPLLTPKHRLKQWRELYLQFGDLSGMAQYFKPSRDCYHSLFFQNNTILKSVISREIDELCRIALAILARRRRGKIVPHIASRWHDFMLSAKGYDGAEELVDFNRSLQSI